MRFSNPSDSGKANKLTDESPYFPRFQSVKGPDVFVLYEYLGCVYGLMGEAHQSWSFAQKETETEAEWETRTKKTRRDVYNFIKAEDSVTVFLTNLFLSWEREGIAADFYLEREYEKGRVSESVPFGSSAHNIPNSLDQLRLNLTKQIMKAPFSVRDPQKMNVHYHLCEIRSFRHPGLDSEEKGERDVVPRDPARFHWGKLYETSKRLLAGTPLGLGANVEGLFEQLVSMVEELGRIRDRPPKKRPKLESAEMEPSAKGTEIRDADYQISFFLLELVVVATYIDFCYVNALEFFDVMTSGHVDAGKAFDDLYETFDLWLVGSRALFYRKEFADVPEDHYMALVRKTWSYDYLVVRFLKECKQLLTFAKGVRRENSNVDLPRTHHRIGKQLEGLEPELKEKIKSFLRGKLAAAGYVRYELFKNVDWVKRVEVAKNAGGAEGWKLCKTVRRMLLFAFEHLGDLDTFFMDAYLLGRMFYNAQPPSGPTDSRRRSTVALAYTGSFHTATYSDFFKNYLKAKVLGRSEYAQFKLHEVGDSLPMWQLKSGLPVYVVGDLAYLDHDVSYEKDLASKSKRIWNFRLTPEELLEFQKPLHRLDKGFRLRLSEISIVRINHAVSVGRSIGDQAKKEQGAHSSGELGKEEKQNKTMLFGMSLFSSESESESEEESGTEKKEKDPNEEEEISNLDVESEEGAEFKEKGSTATSGASKTEESEKKEPESSLPVRPALEAHRSKVTKRKKETSANVGSKCRLKTDGAPNLILPCIVCRQKNALPEHVCTRCRMFGACSSSCAVRFFGRHEEECRRYFNTG